MSNTFLSKSSFIKGLQCHKQLWFYKNHPELKDPVDDNLQAVFDTGHEVGELATQLFPNGQMLPCDDLSLGQQTDTTRKWIEQGVETIYEAAFSEKGVFARVDILHKGPDGWELYEVKSSTKAKEVYIQDVAVQTWILKQAGLKVSKSVLITLDSTYHRQGDIDVQGLFSYHDLTEQANALQGFVQTEIDGMKAMLTKGEKPEVPISKHCEKPYQCLFYSQCHGEATEDSAFRIVDTGKPDSYALYHAGQTSFADVDLNQLKWRQRQQVESYLNQTNHVKGDELRQFLLDLWYPICYLDFETTYMVAIPMFDGTRPYQQIPFQFSMHIQHEMDGPVEHIEFLAEPGVDPRPALLEKLLSSIPKDACILAYNKGFEERCLKEMAQAFPEYSDRIQPLFSNMRDLMVPFRNKDVYYWQMNGSYSLKNVLPALLPGMGYADLVIANGEAAANAYISMESIVDPSEREAIREHLLKYCELDTLAMVKLLEKLRELAEE